MPDRRKHRGPHPEDRSLFGSEALPRLRAAVEELSWLLTRGYPPKAALKLTGDRHLLNERQRTAVNRAACSDASRDHRRRTRAAPAEVAGRAVEVDGFNLIITLEAALSGGLLFRCRDGCIRDLASIHGSYRTVEETDPAVDLAARALERWRPASVRWLLDSPISNSGRLAARIRARALEGWSVETVFNPDRELIGSDAVIVSADANVLDGVGAWLDVTAELLPELPEAWCVELADS